jgi:serine/threonine-protein kinase
VERQIQALVENYLERLQAGERPDSFDLILAHPSIARELEQRLEAVRALHRLAEESGELTTGDNGEGQTRREAGPGPATGDLPALIGRYRILGTLGKGASSVVYRAHDPKFQREVALKVVRLDALAGADSHERFERDARGAARLRHPNIVPLHETGEHAGLRYIDMEMVAGETLEA